MDAKTHKEYQDEKTKLDATYAAVENLIREPLVKNLGGGDDWANHNLKQKFFEKKERYKDILGELYFGRIDFENKAIDTFYIGKLGISKDSVRIIDWRAPISRLYYSSNALKQSYVVDNDQIYGNLLLKRTLNIKGRELLTITDRMDYREGFTEEAGEEIMQKQLIDEIQVRGDINLQEIVKTIQAEQDDIIRSPLTKTIIIDGVAGSGKTSIAFHRLAYLLFPNGKLSIHPNNCIVFCPNKIFLQYIENLLPGLGVKNVQQTTFADWAFKQMNLKGYSYTDTPLQKFTKQDIDRTDLISLWKRASLKGQLKIEKLLENYVDYLRSSIRTPKKGMSFESKIDETIKINISYEILDKQFHRVLTDSKSPINRLRQVLRLNLRKELRDQLDQKINELITEKETKAKNGSFEAVDAENEEKILELINKAKDNKKQADIYRKYQNIPGLKDKIFIDLNNQLKAIIDEIWNISTTVEVYYQLIKDSQLLNEINKGVLTSEEINTLTQSKFDGYHIELEDLPAIFLLYQLLNGKSDISYDHIIIDEVQDFSPLMLKIIKQFSSLNSMTLVGDLSQSIHAYRGLNNWDILEDIFSPQKFEVMKINKNYRNTKEIVNLTNRILSETQKDKEKPLPTPINRSGPEPNIKTFIYHQGMIRGISKEIDQIQDSYQFENIALITKSKDEAEDLYLKLSKGDNKQTLEILTDEDGKYSGGVVCLPIELAKGLEFEAAIVVNASNSRYKKEVPYDGQLLYVATTRALHYLAVFSVHRVSKYFD